jgi:hypothetical protein
VSIPRRFFVLAFQVIAEMKESNQFFVPEAGVESRIRVLHQELVPSSTRSWKTTTRGRPCTLILSFSARPNSR